MSETAEIPLSYGKVALVDAADLPLLAGRNWYAQPRHPKKEVWYAVARGRRPGPEPGTIYMARLLLDFPSVLFVDHINGDTLDNRRSNLRSVTPRQNALNRHELSGASGYRGVYKSRPGRWVAQLRVGFGKTLHLGVFDCPVAAAKKYDEAARIHLGAFSSLNFPEEA